jgi:myo-inositol-1(or 4)-monophosphatase
MTLAPKELKEKLFILEKILKDSSAVSMSGFSMSPGAQPKVIKREEKSSFSDIVTEFDQKVEDFLVSKLEHFFKNDKILGEEGAYKEGVKKFNDDSFSDKYIWVLDPIDGTANYSRSYPYFCTTVCLLEKKESRYHTLLGATFDPVRNEIFSAIRGQGAYLNGDRIQVSSNKIMEQALFVTGFAAERDAQKDAVFDRFVNLTRKSLGVRRTGAAALDLAYVAAGRLDAYWECGLNVWDIAAGTLLVQEALGKVTHFERNEEWNLWTGELLASNQHLHSVLLKELNA